MRGFVLIAMALLACAVYVPQAGAHGPVIVRRTPFRPFVGPAVVGRGFVPSRAFVPTYGSRAFVPSYGSRSFGYGQPTIVVDRFGRTFIVP